MTSPFPTNYKPTDERFSSNRFFNAKSLSEGKTVEIRLCGTAATGHVISGYKYFTMEKRPRLFPLFPRGYAADIGMAFNGQEKAEPFYFLSWAALMKGADEPVIFEITQPSLQTSIEQTLALEDYQVDDGKPANFYLTISKVSKNNKPTYTAIPTLKAVSKSDAPFKLWEASRSSIWLPAMFEGGDPFAGPPAGAAGADPQLNATVIPAGGRDVLGADEELESTPVAAGSGW
jgi:hypothetical protein